MHNAAAESKQLEQFLHDPTVPRETKIAGLDAVLDAMKVSDLTKRFLGAPSLLSTTLSPTHDACRASEQALRVTLTPNPCREGFVVPGLHREP